MTLTRRTGALAALAFLLAACGGTTDTATPAPDSSAPTVTSFTANPPTVVAGQSSTLSFSVVPATATVNISGGVGTVSGTSATVTPSATTTYTLTVTSNGQTATARTTVTVTGQPG